MSGPEPSHRGDLRIRAEAALKYTGRHEGGGRDLIERELRIHQVELELQNEELRLAQEDLQACKERYFDLYDLAPVGYLAIDGEDRVLEVNATAAQLLGTQKRDMMHRPLTDFVCPDFQDDFYLRMRNLGPKNRRETFEAKLASAARPNLWARVILTVEAQPGKKRPPFYRVALVDISERKQAQEKFQRIVEAFPVAVFFHSEREIVFANAQAAAMLHLPGPEALKGRSLLPFVHPEDRTAVATGVHQVLEGGASSRSVTVRLEAGGGETEVELILSPLTFEDTTTVEMTAYNLTRRKKMEQELLKAEKLESLSTLAGGIAHDFNNYLTVLLGNLSLAMANADDPGKLSDYLASMKQATLHTRDLTSRLFAFTKNKELIKEVCSIERLIEESATFALSGSNVRCDFSIAENLPAVEVDKGQMAQVLYNIIINAAQAMPEGGRLTVRAEPAAPSGDAKVPGQLVGGPGVRVSISDKGPGIPKDVLDKVFDPFFTTKESGSGLGLASAYTIIQNHRGTIHVSSQVGYGTTVSFWLPALTAPAPAGSEEVVLPGEGRILIMDDEGAIRDVIDKMLTGLGYEVCHAADGQEAIERYREARSKGSGFDLVIMDLTVRGGIGGKQAMQALAEADPGVRAIVASGYSKDPVMSDYRRHGFKGVLKKPFSIAELSRVLRDALR